MEGNRREGRHSIVPVVVQFLLASLVAKLLMHFLPLFLLTAQGAPDFLLQFLPSINLVQAAVSFSLFYDSVPHSRLGLEL